MSTKRARGTKRKAASGTNAEDDTANSLDNSTPTKNRLNVSSAAADEHELNEKAGTSESGSKKKGLSRMPTISLVGFQPVSELNLSEVIRTGVISCLPLLVFLIIISTAL